MNDLTRTIPDVFDLTIPTVTYRSGPIDAGFLISWIFKHTGREGTIATPAVRAAANTGYSTDLGQQYGAAYFKYNNGRFFLNAEYDFDRQSNVRNYSANFTLP